MIGNILASILDSLLTKIISKIQNWTIKKKLEAAQTKADALESYIKSVREVKSNREKIDKAVKQINDKYGEIEVYEDRLRKLRELNGKEN